MVTIRRLSTKRTITYHLESLNISKPKYMDVDIQVVAGNTTMRYLMIPTCLYWE